MQSRIRMTDLFVTAPVCSDQQKTTKKQTKSRAHAWNNGSDLTPKQKSSCMNLAQQIQTREHEAHKHMGYLIMLNR